MNKKVWDVYAPIYERAMRMNRKMYLWMYKRIPKKVLSKKGLEIATGPGMLSKRIAKYTKSIVATDYSEGMISEAKKGRYSDKLTFEIADATNLPYKDDSFEVVIIANALHVIPNPEKALQEISRVLKSDGILIAPNFINKSKGLVFKVWLRILKIAGISFEHKWDEESYLKFLEQNGWRVDYYKILTGKISLVYTECTSGCMKRKGYEE